MKKISSLLIIVATAMACNLDGINKDPDLLTPDSASLSTELPVAITGVVGAQGAYYALIGGFWSQYWTQSNSANQYKNIDDYSLTTDNFTGAWNAMFDALNDIRNIKKNALTQENWNYYLIATCLEAYASQILVDFYDQIPYTEANNPAILDPMFQSGQEVYDLLIAGINDALNRDLSTAQGTLPSIDDFIFEGDMDLWVQFANTLKLKIYLRQTEARPSVAQAGIQDLLNSGAEFLSVDAAMTQFIDEASRSNPLYETDRRQLNTTTNLRASTTLNSFLIEYSDSRRDAYYGPGNSLNQGDYNSGVAQNTISVVTLYPTTPVYLISAEDSFFMQAEASERYNGGINATALYNQGVIEAFSKFGLDGSAYVIAGGTYEYPAAGTFDQRLQAIITQKWVAGFPGNGFEAFFDTNRTGYPLTSAVPQTNPAYVPGELVYSVTGTTGGEFPRRLILPSSETTTNPNAPNLVELTVPVWWDVN